MIGIFTRMRTAILADGTIAPLVDNRVYSLKVPGNQKPAYISLMHSGNTPTRTAGGVMLELLHITLNVYMPGQDSDNLDTIVDALRILFDNYNEQSGGRSYSLLRIFDMLLTDVGDSLKWSFEYRATITDD